MPPELDTLGKAERVTRPASVAGAAGAVRYSPNGLMEIFTGSEWKRFDPLRELHTEKLGEALYQLSTEHAEWSQATFGSDADRGPVGGLKHLAKEVAEVLAVWSRRYDDAGHDRAVTFTPEEAAAIFRADWRNELRLEFADCLILLLDAARRSGIMPLDLLAAGIDKMAINRAREWPAPKDGEPCEHVRS